MNHLVYVCTMYILFQLYALLIIDSNDAYFQFVVIDGYMAVNNVICSVNKNIYPLTSGYLDHFI